MHLPVGRISLALSLILAAGLVALADSKLPTYGATPPPLTAKEISDLKTGRVTEVRDSQGNIKVIKAGIFTPRPRYPEYARERGWGGAGLYVMNVNKRTGLVTSVDVIKSTGHRI